MRLLPSPLSLNTGHNITHTGDGVKFALLDKLLVHPARVQSELPVLVFQIESGEILGSIVRLVDQSSLPLSFLLTFSTRELFLSVNSVAAFTSNYSYKLRRVLVSRALVMQIAMTAMALKRIV